MAEDYKKLGLKCGLEIHQQLDSHKLFCNCPSVLRKDEPDFEIKRKLHVVAGESGEVDVAAQHEAEQDKEFVYQGYDTICLVELDEEPPHQINQEALKIALQISLLLNCKIISLAQIMRKTVVDGSNTSGFQRTVMIARHGYVETEAGRVGIEGVFLEEDSARPVSREGKKDVYRLDRLGVPLVEIATAPDIKTPEQAKEVALHIGNILRSCKVKRGIGTIRQDINISIKGTNRVELKGFQDPKIMVGVVEKEMKRQLGFVKNVDVHHGRTPKNLGKRFLLGANPSEVRNVLVNGESEFSRPMPGEARMYPETDLPLLKISRDLINNAKKNLPKLRSEVEKELKQKGLTDEMISMLFKQNKLEEFKELFEIVKSPLLVGKVLLMFPKELATKNKKSISKINEILNKEILANVLERFKKKKIKENQIKNVLDKIVKGEEFGDAIKFKKKDLGVVEEKIIKIIKEKPGLSEKAYMGLIMKEFKGQVDGREVSEIIRKLCK